MRDDEVKHGPAERETARFAGEAADHLCSLPHFAERALEQMGGAPALSVLERIVSERGRAPELVRMD